jgi:hypothetical protein
MNRLITAEIKKNQRKDSFTPTISSTGTTEPEILKKKEKSIKDIKKQIELERKKNEKKKKEKKNILLVEGDDVLILIYQKIENFISDSNQKSLSFPSSIDSFYRKKIHSLSDQLELNSFSLGKGEDRFISLKKNESIDYSNIMMTIVKSKGSQSPIPQKDNEPIVFRERM